MPYKERVKFLPSYATINGKEFHNIVYPKTKSMYNLIIALARETYDKNRTSMPEWFNEDKKRSAYITLYFYLLEKIKRDKGPK